MSAYYNELDPFAAAWLRNLIAAGHIAPGDVDERDVRQVDPSDLIGYDQCHFFAGIGGWSYALRLAGVADDAPVWTGSCPCQPFSAAGRRTGFEDPRHLWPTWFRLIEARRPALVLGEQSDKALAWLDLVFDDLEGAGYACRAADLPAAGAGAPHKRQRLWFVADAREQRRQGLDALLLAGRPQPTGVEAPWSGAVGIPCSDGLTRLAEPGVFPLAHGIPGRVGRLRAYGNAIVPQTAAAFIEAALESVP